MRNIRILTLSVLISSLFACGYALQGSGSVLPPDVQRIQIPLVENNSIETALTPLVTEALRDQFERFGVVTIVEDITDADAVLNARILSVSRKSRTVTSGTDTVQQYDTSFVMFAELRRTTGQILWANPAMTISRAVGTSRDLVVSSSADFAGGTLSSSDLGSLDTREIARGQEQNVLEEIARLAARRIYDDAVAPDF